MLGRLPPCRVVASVCVVGLVTPSLANDDGVKWFGPSTTSVCDSRHPPSVSFRRAMPYSMALNAGSEETNCDNDSFEERKRAACPRGGLLPAEGGGIHGICQPRTLGSYDGKTRLDPLENPLHFDVCFAAKHVDSLTPPLPLSCLI